MFLNKFKTFYRKFEIYISIVTFSFGLITTFFTLTRVDMLMENVWIVINLCIAVVGIFSITLYENRLKKKNITDKVFTTFHFYLTLLIQFAFGGLFATYFVFYIRSSSISDSWLFLLLLIVFLVGNEIWKKHYTRMAFQISVLYLSLFLFFIFLLPVLFHRLGVDLFIASGILALAIIFVFLYFLKKFAQEKFQDNHKFLRKSLIGIFLAMNIMYFTNIIPPVPLSLKDTGVYHSIVKTSASSYKVMAEPEKWTKYLTRFPLFHKQAGEPVYVYSAVFSPIKFESNIVHQWQYYDEAKKKWVESSRIVIPIVGGREQGFRNYSWKQSVFAGLWRVKVMTLTGQVLGKINFRIENTTTAPELVSKNL